MNRVFASLLSLVAVLSLLPTAHAQTAVPVAGCSEDCDPQSANGGSIKTGSDPIKVILFAHYSDLLNRAPLNMQILSEKEPVFNQGFIYPTVSTRLDPDYDLRFDNNWFYMYSSAGLVEIADDGTVRVHQEPGIAENIRIKSPEVTLYFYLSAYPIPTFSSDGGGLLPPGPLLDVMPQVAIYARMEAGRNPGTGKVIAQGDTGADDVAGLLGGTNRVNIVQLPTGDDIYEFKVPMTVENPVIPTDANGDGLPDGFTVSINPYQIKGKPGSAIEDWQVMQADWRVRIGPNTPPRLVFEMNDPMVTKAASLSIFDNNMIVRWSFVSPFGSYDFDQDGLTSGDAIKITGPKEVDKSLIKLVNIKYSRDHDGHFKPVNLTWKLDYAKASLPDGEYTVELQMKNLQGTYVLKQPLSFTMAKGAPQNLKIVGAPPPQAPQVAQKKDGGGLLPGFETVLLVGAVLLASFTVSRRRL